MSDVNPTPGARRLTLWVFALMAVTTVAAAIIVVTTVQEQSSGAPPYDIKVPGIIDTENEDGQKVAADGRIRVITERCNTTDGVLSLDISTSWVSREDRALVVAGAPFVGATIPPGGSFCDPPTQDPIVSGIELPDTVEENPGLWEYQSEITVYECTAWTPDPEVPNRFECDERGEELDRVGWFSEDFLVEPT